jgi:hypothetical protein
VILANFLIDQRSFGPGLPDCSWYKIPKREKYTKLPQTIPNVHKIYHHLPLQGPPKFTQVSIFGFKTNHLATLIWAIFFRRKMRPTPKTIAQFSPRTESGHAVSLFVL